MRRRHEKPFGCELTDRGAHFNLWAPSVAEVRLLIEHDAPVEHPMRACAGGWHRLVLPDVGPGCRYRFRLPDGLLVPDPASRFNPDDVHGPSEVIDPLAFDWVDPDWQGRPWEEAVIYELHVGTFSPEGTYRGVEDRLDDLARLGVTAIEIMPVADFPGRRNWGYDGVLPYAPDASYGRPEDFKRLIGAAHRRGLMVLLDVVYNHFGPEGNYLHRYAPDFFNPKRHTPWGAAINFDGTASRTVREFFLQNALFWLREYHLDGLRLDAVHAICDDSSPHIIEELAAVVRAGPGRERPIHLIVENDRNQSHYLRRDAQGACRQATAQWNDDIHHALHVIATGETDGYYADYCDDPLYRLARCLGEGFAYQGEPSEFRGGAVRGEPSAALPPTAFVNFLQTHDQVGNRAFGERLCRLASPAALRAVTAVLLLAPSPPLLFMGEEFAARQPFLYFCDFGPDLANAVADGRRREFASFARFADSAERDLIPDPNAAETFVQCVLDWSAADHAPHREMLALYRRLLAVRHAQLIPRLSGIRGGKARFLRPAAGVIAVTWRLADDSEWQLLANLCPKSAENVERPDGSILFALPGGVELSSVCTLPAWSVLWMLRLPVR